MPCSIRSRFSLSLALLFSFVLDFLYVNHARELCVLAIEKIKRVNFVLHLTFFNNQKRFTGNSFFKYREHK